MYSINFWSVQSAKKLKITFVTYQLKCTQIKRFFAYFSNIIYTTYSLIVQYSQFYFVHNRFLISY